MTAILFIINAVFIGISLYVGSFIAESSGIWTTLLLYSLPLIAIIIANFLGAVFIYHNYTNAYDKMVLYFYKVSVFIAIVAPASLIATGYIISIDDIIPILTIILVVAILTWIGSFNKFRTSW